MMLKTTFTLMLALAAPSLYAADSPHVIQGMRVGDNKYKVISISNMKCADAHKQTLPYEPHSEVDAMVCTWTSSGKAFIVMNTVTPETLVVKFYAPGVRVGEITANYAQGVTYDQLRSEFNAKPFSEVKPGKGQFGEAYWIDGELLTRLSCTKATCTVTSGSHYGKAKLMTDERLKADKIARMAAESASAKAASAAAAGK
ncbi:hypothetical protein GCM10027277_06390 [Pseudoduganella ginsengisoli]|uniref:Uncharacterized protein n=1 Tax=Pseudoduganella ginsengisoli TaxID=1462440 RepID=A0A6L6Q774_9BURK|nr:hypothetical protein [Pseudoduganella ginsengisoli]MTW05299.1 hypothetical protein [Pseudoduganella ginsengisoli]